MDSTLPKLVDRCSYRITGIDLKHASQCENRLGQLHVGCFQLGIGLANVQ